DYFYANQKMPQYAKPDEIEFPLLSYLCERQVDSLTIPVLIKIIDWMSHGNDELAQRMLRYEIPALRRSLEKGEPAVLCLIRAQPGGNLTHNHQVVATGFELDSEPGSIIFTLYVPNHPQTSPTITASLSRTGFSISQSSGEALRGFFRMPYKARKTGLPAPALLPGEASFALEAAQPEPPFRLSWPVDSRRVNQMFGENPATYRPFGLAGHEGIDFYAPTGAKIYAAFEGTISEAKYRGAYGNQVRIRHEHNGVKFITVYAHMEKILASANQQVKAGDLIGLADNTGNSRGSHLHFTLFIEGEKTKGYYDGIVDPWAYFEGNEPPPPPQLSGVVVYTKQDVNLRSLPTTNSDVITLLPAGESLPVFGVAEDVKKKIGREPEWLQVKTGAGQTGYLAAWLVADSAGEVFLPSGLIIYAYDELPLRSGPGLGLGQMGKVGPTTPLNILGSAESSRTKIGQKDQWLQVLAPDSTRGFVPAWLVRVTGEIPPATGLYIT
ncbi:MAG: peptidoglycan DD-metalloendopeptidase family protein, partial [Anaerolineaceae bacterium]|nr:peptidoglycan DD-metalloendopeptidase family protein [Anaerolineaceae bacterium]